MRLLPTALLTALIVILAPGARDRRRPPGPLAISGHALIASTARADRLSWRKTDTRWAVHPASVAAGDHNGPPMATTVLIVDDHSAFRSRARRMLEADGFEVVGEAADGASGVDAARRLEPDVVLLDLQLPDTTGFAVAEEIAGEAAVVITSTRDSADFDALARRSGARGFVSKAELSGAALEELLP